MSKINKLATVIRKIVREEVQKEVKKVINENKEVKEKLTLAEAVAQTELEEYPTMKTFNANDARAGFAAMQNNINNMQPQRPTAFEGHNGRVIPESNIDPSVTKAMTRDYSELVKRFKK